MVAVDVVLVGGVRLLGASPTSRPGPQAQIDELAEANPRLDETMAENAGLHAQLLTQAREAGVLATSGSGWPGRSTTPSPRA